MRFSTRHLLFLMALATLVLSGLGMGGVAVTLVGMLGLAGVAV